MTEFTYFYTDEYYEQELERNKEFLAKITASHDESLGRLREYEEESESYQSLVQTVKETLAMQEEMIADANQKILELQELMLCKAKIKKSVACSTGCLSSQA